MKAFLRKISVTAVTRRNCGRGLAIMAGRIVRKDVGEDNETVFQTLDRNHNQKSNLSFLSAKSVHVLSLI